MKFPQMQLFFRQGLRLVSLVFIVHLLLSVSSCVPAKKYVYLHSLQDRSDYPNETKIEGVTKFEDPKIQSNDVLSVSIQTIVQNESNSPVSSTVGQVANPLSGFLVDHNGYIELSLIGFVKVGGLTTAEARELVKQKAKKYYISPVVNVRIVNFEVLVSGDVGRPGTVLISDEKATVVDVLTRAGGLSNTARRTNVLLTRREEGETKFVRLDLTSTDIYSSPYFYVRQRDHIYVEPNGYKRQTSDNSLVRYLGYSSGLIGVISLLFLLNIIK